MVSVTSDEIRTGDVARVNDMASNVSFGRDHELLHAIPQDYIIDQQAGITEPIGMTGSRIGSPTANFQICVPWRARVA